MPERQIAFASTWFYRDGQHVTAHRGEIIDIPENEVTRLEELGALVPEGGELVQPGQLLPLLANASDEHVANYVASGNIDEIIEQSAEYPTALTERIVIAERAGQARERLIVGLEARVRGESQLTEPVTVPDVQRPIPVDDASTTNFGAFGSSTVEDSVGLGTASEVTGTEAAPVDNGEGISDDGGGQASDSTLDPELVEFVSTNTVEAVLERAGEDPETAAALREAEESRGDKARKGVIEGLSKIENPEG